ncbi:MAG: right-handed parallel beta-helix repeat-containing protein [Planctomycetota bacterium]
MNPLLLLPLLLSPQQSRATVTTVDELRDAVSRAKPGTVIQLAPGTYAGGLAFKNVRGEAGKPVVIEASDPKNPPVVKGGGTGLQLSSVAHVEIRDLAFDGCTGNGLNIDDSGKAESPSHHVVLKNLRITRIGSKGNQDGIKLSGVTDFRVDACVVDQWGAGGSAIDMVGCHRGVIEANTFMSTAGTSSGVQTKGGSSDITIRKNRFENAGSRAVNIGGSTGRQYFRPALAEKPPEAIKSPIHVEARNITVEGNTFIGSDSPIAFVGVDAAIVRFNTIYAPNRWAIRILQETADADFIACRNGKFTDNIVAFKSAQWSSGGVNIGANTEPSSFVFARNVWYCLDAPTAHKPKLPADEQNGVYGTNPQFRDPSNGDVRLGPNSPVRAYGAEALK